MAINRTTVGLSLQIEDRDDIDAEAAKLGLGRSAYLVLCHKQRKYIVQDQRMIIPVIEGRQPKPRKERNDKGKLRGPIKKKGSNNAKGKK